ncbi:dual specificity protein phosphatase Mpk3-like [Lycorma delicatula]|uniref:dual specificity protein phosphatase Mpk3-like n=1 Tax=Lycorma delicatula TaxID=130591 RepID=UPI003F5183F4
MPSEEDENERCNLLELCITKECLLHELRANPSRLVILDCRSSNEYGESHIRNAVNFSIPSIMLRRLAAGKIDLISTIKCRELKEKIMNAYKENLFVVYGDTYITDERFRENSFTAGDTVHVLTKRLLQDGCRVVCLEDGFEPFHASYPEWCESCCELLGPGSGGGGAGDLMGGGVNAMPLMGLRSLRISSWRNTSAGRGSSSGGGESSEAFSGESSPSDSADEHCDSSLGLEDDRDFPVEILPRLFLGNAANSGDSDSLRKHGIQYILNVTPDLPNVFEGTIKYMNIPITDHWSQNLASFFPKAIEFIDEARSQDKGVLVHCLAGVSRSVTITVAYLMAKHSLSLNDAFCLVRARKSNIAPNFHFMEQLHSFEQELRMTSLSDRKQPSLLSCEVCGSPKSDTTDSCIKCTSSSSTSATFLSPLSIVGQSPDSGIEFDRWMPAPGE